MGMLDDVLPKGKLTLMCIPYTAFTEDGSAIVMGGVQKQAEYAVAMGNDACLLQGTTGEWPSLSLQERIDLAKEWRRCIPHGQSTKLVLHIGHDALPDAKTLATLAQELKYDAVLLSPPSKFVAPRLEAQVACLKDVLRHCPDTPAFYYHYPGVCECSALFFSARAHTHTHFGV
jgi:N-acetylneuraminate lyase